MIITGLQSTPLDVSTMVDRIRDNAAGAVVVFEGVTRSSDGELVASLLYEAWERRAEKQLREIADDAMVKWPLIGLIAVHRTGVVPTGEPGVVVAVSSAHRDAAFDASRYVIDRLKDECAIWKQEQFVDGSARWVGVQ